MKVVIITRNENPWASFIVSQFAASNIQVLVVNEKRCPERPYWASLRFIRRRGILAYADLLLQSGEATLASWKRRILGSGSARKSHLSTAPFNLGHPYRFQSTLNELAQDREKWKNYCDWVDVDSVNSDETVQLIKSAGAPFAILCAAPLVKRRTIANAGILINAHCGISPLYKGSSPIQWAAFNRDWGNIGFTIHVVTSDVDGGPIIYQERHLPRPGWSLTDLDWFLVYSMYRKLAELAINNELSGKLESAIPQSSGIPNRPPMGLIRSSIAAKRLRDHLAGDI